MATTTKKNKRSGTPSAATKTGAPAGNDNAMTHGLRAGKLPHGCAWIMTLANQFRRSLESAVIDAKGEVSVTDAASINSAVRWERHSTLCLRWLRFHVDDMNHDQRLAYSREVARASTERDKCIKSLGLDVRELGAPQPMWFDSLDATPAAIGPPPAPPILPHDVNDVAPCDAPPTPDVSTPAADADAPDAT